jgi:Fe-S-cluster containining protein
MKTKLHLAKKKMTSNKQNFSENDRIFYADGYKLAQSAAEKELTTETLFQAIESLYQAIDGLNDSILALAKRQNVNVACAKGCQWCCHQAVFANSYEIHYLSEKIKANFKDNDISIIRKSCEAKNHAVTKLSNEQMLNYKSPCPLLSNGACAIYFARPMACRIYLSTKLQSCLDFYHHPENESSFPALIDFPLRAGRMMNEGFTAALKELGVETAEFRLEEGLLIALNQKINLSANQ